MTFIVPFQDEFCQEVRTIYAVNNDNPKGWGGSVTSSQECPHCKERHFFRFYENKREYEIDGWAIEVYDCKCPSCRREFVVEIEHEIDL